MNPRSSPTNGAVASVLAQMLLCSLLWASSFLLMKVIGGAFSPLALAALRGAMGGLCIAAWMLARGRSIHPRGREWRDWIVLGVVQGLIPNTLTIYALTQIAAGLSSLIQASTPIIVAAFAHFLFADERLNRWRLCGVAIGVAGMMVLIDPIAATTGPAGTWGALAMLVTAASYAVGNLYVRTIPVADPIRLALGQQLVSGFPALVFVAALGGTAAFAGVPDHLLALAAFGVFATAMPIVLYMNILRAAGPTLGSMNGYLVPLWTIALGALFLGEAPGAREAIGGLVVLAGLIMVAVFKRRPA